MIRIHNYLTTKISKSKIKATDDTIKQIVKEEMDKYGHDCNMNHVDVSEVTDMYTLFSCHQNHLGESYSDLNPDISEWNVSNVTDMGGMFYNCRNFNSNIGNWDVSNVEYMIHMFNRCTNFNQDLSSWNVKKVLYHDNAFNDCPLEEKYKPHFIK